MANTNEVYGGTDYGLDPYDAKFGTQDYSMSSAGAIGVTTDVRTANQLKAVSDKLSTGAKTVEVQLVSPEVADSIPNQHLDEINRLRKLVGAEMTMHGPVVEPTGVTRQGWDESHREQAERQMWNAVERGHRLNPDGNVNVTFHTSNGLPSPETFIINKETGEEELKEMWVVDETNGNFQNIAPEVNKLAEKSEEKMDARDALMKTIRAKEKETWYNRLQGVSFHASNGMEIVGRALQGRLPGPDGKPVTGKNIKMVYGKYVKGEASKEFAKLDPQDRAMLESKMGEITRGDVYLRDAYSQFQNLFNLAFKSAEKKNDEKTLERLKHFRKEIQPSLSTIEDPENVGKLGGMLVKGVKILRSIAPPKPNKLLKDFAVDKSSDTFSNLAIKSYKKFGDSAPIISIENPPAGSGLTRADDIKQLVVETRKKFKNKLVAEGKDAEEAKEQAEKLIGAIWDLGHSNMLRKYGYSKAQIIEEAKKIAPFTNKVHLADNFGLEHTELPMGMGNVPYKEQMEAISKYNKKVKKIIEAGQWYQHFKKTPLPETLEALGSPIYAMEMGPTWAESKGAGTMGSYFAGYGMNPQIHHSMYGAGFSTLPVSLGGQVEGRSRFSGAPIE